MLLFTIIQFHYFFYYYAILVNTPVEHLQEPKPSPSVTTHGKFFLIGPDPVLPNLTLSLLRYVACHIIALRVVLLKEHNLNCFAVCQCWEFLWGNYRDALLRRRNEKQIKIFWEYFLACILLKHLDEIYWGKKPVFSDGKYTYLIYAWTGFVHTSTGIRVGKRGDVCLKVLKYCISHVTSKGVE